MLRLQESAATENITGYKENFEKDHAEFNTTCQRAKEFLE